MQTQFKVIAQREYGAPKDVLTLSTGRLKSEELNADEILIRVITRPIHRGDIYILTGSPHSGPPRAIPSGHERIPGFEGVGTIHRMGLNAQAMKGFVEGQRVAFFPVDGAWGEYVVARRTAVIPVPDEVKDSIAAQMLINVVTASILLRAGHDSLKLPIEAPPFILVNAAASAVARLLTQVALDRGVRPIRLVRSHESAEQLQRTLPGPPVYSTSDSNWKAQVREALGGHKLMVAYDGVGGSAIDDLADVVDDGGTIINFGHLGGNSGTNIYSLAPNSLSLKCVSIMNWFKQTDDEKRKDFDLALGLARGHPDLFQVAHEYEFADFQNAIQHVSRPGKLKLTRENGRLSF